MRPHIVHPSEREGNGLGFLPGQQEETAGYQPLEFETQRVGLGHASSYLERQEYERWRQEKKEREYEEKYRLWRLAKERGQLTASSRTPDPAGSINAIRPINEVTVDWRMALLHGAGEPREMTRPVQHGSEERLPLHDLVGEERRELSG